MNRKTKRAVTIFESYAKKTYKLHKCVYTHVHTPLHSLTYNLARTVKNREEKEKETKTRKVTLCPEGEAHSPVWGWEAFCIC